MRNPKVWIALVSAVAVLLVAVVDTGRRSPGVLTAVHQREPDLDGRWGCASCHGGWGTSMAEACLECHAPIAEQLEARRGLHGTLAADQAARCSLCHSEHHGPDFFPVNRQSFALAGVPDPQAFDHERVGWPMAGPHLELGCAECHEHADVDVLPEGATRFLGLDRNCASCHEDVHEGRLGSRCADCHGQESTTDLFFVDHADVLPLVGGHALGDATGLDCRSCHAEGDEHSLEALFARAPALRPRERSCASCHESPHARKFLVQVAAVVTRSAGQSCGACHLSEHPTFADEGATVTPEQHAASGFALDAPHAEVTCDRCHAPELADFDARYPGRGADQCHACHDDPHDGQFAEGPFSTGGCLACHERHAFEPHAFDATKHALAALVLDGRHLEASCEECHRVPHDGAARVFRGTASRCEDCHDDAHRGFFDARLAEQALARLATGAAGLGRHGKPGSCAECHDTTRFADPREAFDHGRWTGFALEGSHAQASCESCHPRAARPDATGRAFGHVQDLFGEVAGCASCHDDPHQGLFDAAGLPADVDGRAGCARCHAETSFRAFPDGFDHGLWTGFVLDGAHDDLDCASCHAPLRRPDALGRTWGRAAGGSCSSCHADPHAGQFTTPAGIDCGRCHATERFDALAFRHNLDSRFRLDGAHARVACGECHLPTVIRGVETVRYKPLSTECVACHGVQEEDLLRRSGRVK